MGRGRFASLLFAAAFLALGAFLAPEVVSGQADTIRSVDEIRERLRYHYGTSPRFGPVSRGRFDTDLDRVCDGGSAVCHGGDPDRGFCPANVPCHTSEDFLLDALEEAVAESPTSGFVVGQAVYALTKFGWMDDARDIVNQCRAEAWWCQALAGYLLYELGAIEEAEAPFRAAMSRADSAFVCRAGDATWLAGEWDQRRGNVEALPPGREAAADWSCSERLAVSDTLFWLSDPLLHDGFNERWTAHIARAMSAGFSEEIREAVRGADRFERYAEYDWAMTVRRGSWDSFELLPAGRQFRFWTSEEAAPYHFVPDVDLRDMGNPTWSLEGTILDEGVSTGYGPFVSMPVQIARFRRPGALLVAVAGSMAGPRLRRVPEADAHLVLSAGPGGIAVQEYSKVNRTDPRFLARVPDEPHLLGLEVVTEIGIGWERRRILPLENDPSQVSDLLLFDPERLREPGSPEEASSAMFPSDSLPVGSEIGVYWEVYGAGEGEGLEVEVALQREPGGLVDRLRGLFPGTSRESRGTVSWAEPADGPLHLRNLSLDLSGLEPGEYVLLLTVGWGDQQQTVQRRRTFRLGG